MPVQWHSNYRLPILWMEVIRGIMRKKYKSQFELNEENKKKKSKQHYPPPE